MKTWRPGDALPGLEKFSYLASGPEHLAVVRHVPLGSPRATVVLAGPMALERSHGHLTWVRWARVLASNDYQVFRFDFRGVGESTGDFREATFDRWREDLEAVVAHARSHARGRLVLLGLRSGALLGRPMFEKGEVDDFIAWEPPTGARKMLHDTLRRKLTADYAELPGQKRTRDDYIRLLEQGEPLDVEGYNWTGALWRSAEPYEFTEPKGAGRWAVTYLDGRSAESLPNRTSYSTVRIPKPFWLLNNVLLPDLDALFSPTVDRLNEWNPGPAPAVEKPGDDELVVEVKSASGTRRRLEVLDLPAGRCVGTLHLPVKHSRLGLLWVNAGYVPRDGHGGLATQASELLVEKGIPSFRYDLPGLGDAPGAIPGVADAFGAAVAAGAFTEVTSQLVRAVCERHDLEGVVLAGLCGGAVNAIFVGDSERSKVKGLLLLEPEMYLTVPKKTDDEEVPVAARDWIRARLPKERGALLELVDRALATRLPGEDAVGGALKKHLPVKRISGLLFSYWGWMRLLTMENKYARYVPLPRKAILDFVLSRSQLPSVTNMPLASAWQRWMKDHRPALVITAKGKLHEVFFDRINDVLLAGVKKQRYDHLRLEGTNHILTTGGAIAKATTRIEDSWAMFS